MVLWMCDLTLKGRKSFDQLRDHLGLVSIRNCIKGGLGMLKECSTRTWGGGGGGGGEEEWTKTVG